jgi:hypothetical protein
MGHEFVKYRKNHPLTEREKISQTIRRNTDEIPVVIDSVNSTISEAIAGPDSRRFDRNGRLYHFHKDVSIEDVIIELKHRIKAENTMTLKIGLENGKILKDTDSIGELYNKYKDQKDSILYLLVTQETTMYGYIISLLRYVFGPNFMNGNNNDNNNNNNKPKIYY